MVIPEKLKLITVRGPITAKNGKDYCFADAETPAGGSGCPWSTIRWRCISQRVAFPPTWKVGAEVLVDILEFRGRDGEGRFEVPPRA